MERQECAILVVLVCAERQWASLLLLRHSLQGGLGMRREAMDFPIGQRPRLQGGPHTAGGTVVARLREVLEGWRHSATPGGAQRQSVRIS